MGHGETRRVNVGEGLTEKGEESKEMPGQGVVVEGHLKKVNAKGGKSGIPRQTLQR